MTATVSDIIEVLDEIAPRVLAEEWDNVGLQIGDPNWSVQTIWISLDPTREVVEAACRENVDLLVTHHPLIFKPLKSINFSTPLGAIIDLAARHQMAIFAAHTNLDSVAGGINDIIAHRIGLVDLKPIVPIDGRKHFKLLVYASPAQEQTVSRLLLRSGAATGQMEVYRSFRFIESQAVATPSKAAPDNATMDGIPQIDEIRIEVDLDRAQLAAVVEALDARQQVEPLRYDVYPLVSREGAQGLGRVGRLDAAMDLKSLATMIKKKLGLQGLKFAGDPALQVNKVALCSGSGSGLLSNFFASGAQVYVSGDLRYHDARDVQAANCGIIDIGHFHSEHLIVDVLADRLSKALAENEIGADVVACDLENDPFAVL